MTSSEQQEIFTIGHSNRDIDGFVNALRERAIEIVIDVRSAPYSQYSPQFNREPLDTHLRSVGVDYAFAGKHLGGRPVDASCYRGGVIPDGDVDFLRVVDYDEVSRRPWYRDGIQRLVSIANQRKTVVMCSEEDPYRCHRHHLIAQSLIDQGMSVYHIRRKGPLELATPLAKQLSLLP